jgi:hypothetical protein
MIIMYDIIIIMYDRIYVPDLSEGLNIVFTFFTTLMYLFCTQFQE